MDLFQSTFPRGERPDLYNVLDVLYDFNPRSRVGNDVILVFSEIFVTISIHVPAWGTTSLTRGATQSYNISIHVPAWGTTGFNTLFLLSDSISIHVPAWGTTVYSIPSFTRVSSFQSTFPRGERQRSQKIKEEREKFQSTFPRGERLLRLLCHIQTAHFNPRSRVGNDASIFLLQSSDLLISIHVPAWGTTAYRFWCRIRCLFQSTFPRGERRIMPIVPFT